MGTTLTSVATSYLTSEPETTLNETDASVIPKVSLDVMYVNNPTLHPPELLSSSIKSSSTMMRPQSPVSMLLYPNMQSITAAASGSSQHSQDDKLARSNTEVASLNIADDEVVASDGEDVSINSSIGVVDNPEELCLQLQKRLEGLTKMSGQLEKKNKAAAKLIQKQDERLQKVKETGQLLR